MDGEIDRSAGGMQELAIHAGAGGSMQELADPRKTTRMASGSKLEQADLNQAQFSRSRRWRMGPDIE